MTTNAQLYAIAGISKTLPDTQTVETQITPDAHTAIPQMMSRRWTSESVYSREERRLHCVVYGG